MSHLNFFRDELNPYELSQPDKETFLLDQMNELTRWHKQYCKEYDQLLNGTSLRPPYSNLEDIPYIPTSIFKEFELKTKASDDAKLKAIQSSSTSSGIPSQIFVDEDTATRQKKSAQIIFDSFLGVERRPYIIFDAMETARGKRTLSARGAAILSLMGYASRFFFVMDLVDGALVLNEERLQEAIRCAKEEGHFIAYGFTYILYQAHEQLSKKGFQFPDFDNRTFLIHSGGWKRLHNIAVDKQKLNKTIATIWGISSQQVIDFYGLVEQSGVIYPDCPWGYKHVPYYAEIIIRNPHTLSPQPLGEPGLIQLMSLIPRSAPNHSIITDDIGKIVSIDECPCGRRGKAFQFVGRAPKVEVRGCGDVYVEENKR
ncbi:hypothetical protein [Paenibacillus sp. MSJ-34]|uniref:LuxE/PaaK family acyltransferase n=1 Tax=Paenibacillus sp. MSJ-34 TaxID=2841529 RepID=UPI001C10836C|nr:hypothetical protein [Paenibacillus sp. MSJ-34]MBU5441006.1 hypothetical protein [Paenibacillus sp. MSJ-34]